MYTKVLSTEDLFMQHFKYFNVSINSEIHRTAVFLCLLFRTMYMMLYVSMRNIALIVFFYFSVGTLEPNTPLV